MKTNVLKAIGVAAIFAVALCVNASINSGNDAQNVSLTELATATEANAECYDKTWTNNGRCSELSGNCYALSSPVNCDSTANW
ncbi:MAG: hypothetical protein LUH15_19930 [Tannerellaceae bacterium]|nr:hypothetical protein [Tannerellaceae bacterium]